MTLAEALALVDLEPGRTYQCQVGEFAVVVRVSGWTSSATPVSKEKSLSQFMKPFTIEESDLAPGDLSEVEDDMKLLSHSDEADLPDTPEIVMKAKEE
jgi:hypothetical protein